MNTPDEIEHSISSMCNKGATGHFSLKNNHEEFIRVEAKAEKWYLVLNGKFNNVSRDLYFGMDRTMPFIMMYFQLKGTSTFISGNSIQVSVQNHSLNYLHGAKFTTFIKKHTQEEFFCVKIFPELLLQQMGYDEDNPLINFCQRKEPFLTLHSPQIIKPAIHQSIHDYLNCPYEGKLAAAYKENIIVNLFIHQLAVFISDQKEQEYPVSKLSRADVDLLNDIKNYLDKNYLEVVSLQQLTRKFCINSFKLKHGFKQLFNNSVMKYVDDHKMGYARTLLQERGKPVNDIAEELGYQHCNNFSTAFKRKFGYTPVAAQC